MKLGIIYTGGTIGCIGTPLSPIGEALFEAAFRLHVEPVLQRKYSQLSVYFIPFGSVMDSTNVMPHDWVKLAHAILTYYAHVDGFLILHGTDTLSWSAAALSFLLTAFNFDGSSSIVLNKPIILTGSQLPLFEQAHAGATLGLKAASDAELNMHEAIEAVHLGLTEVAVCFQHRLLRGNRTLKTQTTAFDAFSSPNHFDLATFAGEWRLHPALWYPTVMHDCSLEHEDVRQRHKQQLDYIAETIQQAQVALLPAWPVMSLPQPISATEPARTLVTTILQSLLAVGTQGFILQSYGAGNFPSASPQAPKESMLFQQLKAANDQGVIIGNTTQVLTGSVAASTYAAGSWLAEAGVISLRDMTFIAALTKLTVLLSLRSRGNMGWSTDKIKDLMQTNLCGELH